MRSMANKRQVEDVTVGWLQQLGWGYSSGPRNRSAPARNIHPASAAVGCTVLLDVEEPRAAYARRLPQDRYGVALRRAWVGHCHDLLCSRMGDGEGIIGGTGKESNVSFLAVEAMCKNLRRCLRHHNLKRAW